MQMLHSGRDMQDCLEGLEWKTIARDSKSFELQYTTNEYIGSEPDTPDHPDTLFASKFNRIVRFKPEAQWNVVVDINDDGPTIDIPETQEAEEEAMEKWTNKIPAPVLTRWGTVGVAARYYWIHYLSIFRATQVVINLYPSNAKPNKIASGLHSLMLEPIFFCQLAFIKSFHLAFLHPHMQWLMENLDLSRSHGFQCHQMVARYYLMYEDLRAIKDGGLLTMHHFSDFRNTLLNLKNPKEQSYMATRFIDIAIVSLKKHFNRWTTVALLPAALMMETALARVIGRVITKSAVVAGEFDSTVHGRVINMEGFQDFVSRESTEDNQEDSQYSHEAVAASHRIIAGTIDLRGTNAENQEDIQLYFWRRYLPLASHTQSVEAGVKEANLVSTTNRSDWLRSSFAIIRSHMILSVAEQAGGIRRMLPKDRVRHHWKAAEDHAMEHVDLSSTATYKQDLGNIKKLLRVEHYVHKRIQDKANTVQQKGAVNRKLNVLQQRTGVDKTLMSDGLLPYSVTRKGVNEQDILIELFFRGVSVENTTKARGIRALQATLREHETDRVTALDPYDKLAIQKADKGFRILSQAPFKLKDDE